MKPRVGDLLRRWRQQRGRSQLDLALDSGISQRHLSFLESGRSPPSRAVLSRLSQTLDVPLRERNQLLLASGYAPQYPEPELESHEMALVLKAIERMLLQQEPYPALVLDRCWNVVKTNEAAPRFFGSFVDLEAWPKPRNLLHMMFDPAGLRPFVANWEEVALALLCRVRRETPAHVTNGSTRALVQSLEQYPGVRELSGEPNMMGSVVPITFMKGDQRWSYFSMVTTLGTPQFVSAQELRIECMFPVDLN